MGMGIEVPSFKISFSASSFASRTGLEDQPAPQHSVALVCADFPKHSGRPQRRVSLAKNLGPYRGLRQAVAETFNHR